MAAAFATLLIVTALVGGWGAFGYWRAGRQAALAQALGQEVRDLEWLYRAAQMSPLHPIEGERRQIRERIARLAGLLEDVGALGAGPVNYAIGRGHLALGEAATALEYLRRAWDAGYRNPDAAVALGLAHGELFRLESARAQRIADDRARAARMRELETAHRDPALGFLESGRASAIVPARFLEALIASHRGDIRTAVARAGDAARETPWLFEARLLAGHLEFAEAVRRYFMGNISDAAARARDADRHYRDAHGIAASAVDAYLGRCTVAGLVLHMAHHGLPTDPEPPYREAEEMCSRALTVAPEHAEAHRLFGEAVRFWGNGRVQQGHDPGDAYERSAAFTRRALALSGGDLESMVALADTFLDQAWWQEKQGGDPRAALAEAVAMYEKALSLDARNLTAVHNMGQAFLLRGRFESARGLDPLPSVERAIDSFARGLRSDPTLAFGYRNVARSAAERASLQRKRGQDPAAGLAEVVRFVESLPGDPALPARVEALESLKAGQ